MPVVGEDAIRQHRDGMPGEALSQNSQKVAIISWLGEQGRSAGGAVDDMAVLPGYR
jgi:hypothetical protein